MTSIILGVLFAFVALNSQAQPLKKVVEDAQAPAIEIEGRGYKQKPNSPFKEPTVELDALVQTQTAAIKELKAKIDQLEARVKLLETKAK